MFAKLIKEELFKAGIVHIYGKLLAYNLPYLWSEQRVLRPFQTDVTYIWRVIVVINLGKRNIWRKKQHNMLKNISFNVKSKKISQKNSKPRNSHHFLCVTQRTCRNYIFTSSKFQSAIPVNCVRGWSPNFHISYWMD